ncbi:SusC/RagA family TonB-linked outer membrane protein [Fulvivirga maritima]|uniref:SusC/RagA family TonB-linked outer membrane protein n=1 Tax=Fulvivirga maritima TaxID=2904247 RepID=UPI001F15BC20|nr:SusC/RagA family TonB-linked outer membrane protein [Fulvivirga maritima]UII27657.1 SusC/RagA family TonB-linked outer membrane protein [Fulvivirga maritima]
MKTLLSILFCAGLYLGSASLSFCQQMMTIHGKVIASTDSLPLPGASVTVKTSLKGTITDSNGSFSLEVPEGSMLVFSYIGYESQERAASSHNMLVALSEDYMTLGEVEIYSTGYEEVPVERATGSYEQVSEQLINRSVGADIISRLDGATSGLLFDRRLVGSGATYGDDYRNLRIRGISSINSETNPLIVLDGFPYEGDINSINPNDIDNITVLKDAAAASIWGARAANGVIVISTKKGTFQEPLQINLVANARISQAPDLYDNPNYLSAQYFMEIEKSLFDQGFYDTDLNSLSMPALSPFVELLAAQREGELSEEQVQQQWQALETADVRKNVENLFYQNGLSQQYALSLQGGNTKSSYYFSGGYDALQANVIGNESERVTLTARNTFKPIKQLQLQTGLFLSSQRRQNNGLAWGGYGSRYPYNQLIDDNGNALPVVRDYRLPYVNQAEEEGLLNWQYLPLEERDLMDNTIKQQQQRINVGLQYEFLPNTSLQLSYQYQHQSSEDTDLRSKESYYVRNLVNRFTDDEGDQLFPYNDILQVGHRQEKAHSGRVQLSTYQVFREEHEVSALAGAEVRQVHIQGQGFEYFGYDDEVLTTVDMIDYITYHYTRPNGRARIAPPNTSLSDLLNRYISYYGNMAYTFKQRYTLSGSARWDASNLFGVKTNQKGVPLWSVGAAWTVSKESFMNLSWLPYLRLRATYGYNGNINREATAFVTARYLSSYLTDFQVADIVSPGNPQLRWEKVAVWNAGIDFKALNNRVSGSFEYFRKEGKDLLGRQSLDPTTGFSSLQVEGFMANYANTKTKGWDLTLNTLNLNGAIKWQTDFLVSYAKTRLTSFDDEANNSSIYSFFRNSTLKLKEEAPIDALYAIPWSGLDPNTGAPLVMVDGQESTDYETYFNNLTFEELKEVGLVVPPYFGSIRNTWSYKHFSLSANLTFKLNYVFRRNSISYQSVFDGQQMGHQDFMDRWQNPGDEAHTQVPSMPTVNEASNFRDYAYNFSEVLVEKGDHIRLQDIRLGYTFQPQGQRASWYRSIECYLYLNNLGILWRANDKGLDPDYPYAELLPGPVYAIGTNIKL